MLLIRKKADIYIASNKGETPLDLRPEWRAELTELYEEVKSRAWLARKAFLFVLIGGGYNGSGRPVDENGKNAYEELRDDVLRNVRVTIMSFL